MPWRRDGQNQFQRGMNDTAAPEQYGGDELQKLVNGRLGFDGTHVVRRDGSRRSHSSALAGGSQGWGGTEYRKADGTHQIVVVVGGKAYYSTNQGASWTQVASGLPGGRWDFAKMRTGSTNYLIGVNGGSKIYKWDGSTWAEISGSYPSNAEHAEVLNNRLYVAGHAGIKVRASAVGDFENWTLPDSVLIQVQTHEGDPEIMGLFQLGSSLIIFKRDSTNYLEGYGRETIQVETGGTGVSRSVGCVAPGSIAACGDQGVMWLSERGFEFWTPGQGIQLASRTMQNFTDQLSWANIIANEDLPTATWWPRRHEYWCALPETGAQNDVIYVYRPPTSQYPAAQWLFRPQSPTGDTVTTDADGYLQYSTADDYDVETVGGYLQILDQGSVGVPVGKDGSGYLNLAAADYVPQTLFTVEMDDSAEGINKPWSVGYDGFVREMEVGSQDDEKSDGTGGVPVKMEMHTRPFMFDQEFYRKWLRTIRLLAKCDAQVKVDVTPVADGTDGNTDTLTFPGTTKPITERSMVSVRGHHLTVKLVTTDKARIAGVQVNAKEMQEAI